MLALTVIPGQAGSARLEEVNEPPSTDGPVLVEARALGVCGTDLEIVAGTYGWAPPGRERLVIGHESLGCVLEAPAENGLARGDLVVGFVRRPDPVPCPNCAVGQWDMCRNGLYTEHGIKELDGFCRQRFRLRSDALIRVDPALEDLGVLLEPASVVAKAWDHVERIGHRAYWRPRRALVTGAGPIGLLAALMGRQRGLAVDVLDRVIDGPKPKLVRDLGADYHTGGLKALAAAADIVIECTGVDKLVFDILEAHPPGCVICLAGISSGGHLLQLDLAALNKQLVLENDAVFGSVNANGQHYEQAADSLARADRAWLGRVIGRRVPLSRWQEAFHRQQSDVKTVIDFTL